MIFIKDKLTIDKSYSPNEFLVSLGICQMLKKDESEYFLSVNSLAFLLARSLNVETNFATNLLDGIKGLESKGLIRLKDYMKRNEWIVDITKFNEEFKLDGDEFYSVIDEKDISIILKETKGYYAKSISLIRFYCYLMTTISKTGEKKGVGFLSNTDLAANANLHKNTVLNYLKELEDLKIIYIYRPDEYIIFQTGNIVEIGNTYGLYKDKELIISIGSEFAESYGEHLKIKHKRLEKSVANKTRAYSHKFRYLKKRIDEGLDPEYTYEECKDIYLTMLGLNDRYKNEGHNDRLKDLSIFKTYDFYTGN